MKLFSNIKRLGLIALTAALSLPAWAAELQLRIIQTSDVQAQLTDFDYDNEQSNAQIGYSRTATLIKQAQREVKNSLYVDNGNILQGSPIGDYMLNKGLAEGEKHPSYLALEKSGAMATVIGGRELAHGLAYLDKAVASSQVPVLSANVFDVQTRAPRYKPYQFKIMELTDNTGAKRRVNVAFIGLTSSSVLSHQPALQGQILVSDAVLTARKYVPLLRQLGAEVIIALNQSSENQAALSQMAGLDAVLQTGELAPLGAQIGVLDLNLNYETGRWRVVDKQFTTRAIFDKQTQKPLVRNQLRMKWHLYPYHQATRQFMALPVGKVAENLYSYLSLVQDDATVQLVNAAQKDWVQQAVSQQPALAKLPVLSATAPQKTGKQHSNAFDFAQIEQGDVKQRQLAELVSPSHTVAAVKVNGAELKEWLECSAGAFNQIQAASQNAQPLMNWQFHSQNFDVIDGVSYQFDLSQPARYNHECRLVNEKSQRVKNLVYAGKVVEPKAEFIVATHKQRAMAGQFAGTGAKKVVLKSDVSTRQVVRDFLKKQSENQGFVKIDPDKNWQFSPMNAKVSFETAANERAKAYIALQAQRPYIWQGQDEQGFGVYQFDLKK